MLWSYCIPINISHKFSLKRLIAIIHIQLNKISMIVKCFHVNWFSTVLYAEFYNYLTNQQSDDFFTNEVLFQITATLILQLVQHTALGPHCTFNTRTCDQSFFFFFPEAANFNNRVPTHQHTMVRAPHTLNPSSCRGPSPVQIFFDILRNAPCPEPGT